jgi:hypothetical protein
VTASEELERRYRRWLRWYPPSFRCEYEEEILGVLLAGARDGQRRPGLVECVDLMANGLRLRMRPGTSPADGVRHGLSALIYVGALLELAAAIMILVTSGAVHAAVVDRYPEVTDAQWQAIFAGQFVPHVLAACMAAACWLGLGWAMERGHGWAKIPLAILAGVNACSLVAGVAGGSATVAQADFAVGVALCLVQLLAVAVIFVRRPAGLVRLVAVSVGLAPPAKPSADP